ncbi:MAG: hypothetical protein H8E21_03500 [Gammaproteobacteria bacterium]|nr:hypothetical protein [Gammaproteobacteria bacterium]
MLLALLQAGCGRVYLLIVYFQPFCYSPESGSAGYFNPKSAASTVNTAKHFMLFSRQLTGAGIMRMKHAFRLRLNPLLRLSPFNSFTGIPDASLE